MYHPSGRRVDYCVVTGGGKVESVLSLIGPKLSEYCQKLVAIPDCNFWINEKQIAAYLRLPQGPKHGPSDVLSVVVVRLKKGCGGNNEKSAFFPTGVPVMDLSEDSNRIHFQLNGRKEDFPGGTLSDTVVSRCLCWFRFGNGCVIDVEEQRQIRRELTGSMPVNEKGTLLTEGAPRKSITLALHTNTFPCGIL